MIKAIPVGGEPEDVTLSPDGRFVDVIDATAHRKVGTIAIPGEGAKPMGVVVAPGRPRALGRYRLQAVGRAAGLLAY